MCEFQHLYLGDDGYVVCCKDCGHYQIAFSSIILTLNKKEFQHLRKKTDQKCREIPEAVPSHCKNMIIETPCANISMIFTRKEMLRFSEILELADNEVSALSMLKLFEETGNSNP